LPAKPIEHGRRGRPPRDAKAKGVRKGSRLQISHTIAPDLLAQVDGLAKAMGQTRAALINLAIYQLLSQAKSEQATSGAVSMN
jgi:hypothetical protein